MDISTRLTAFACEARGAGQQDLAMGLMSCAAQVRRMERALDDAVRAAFRQQREDTPVVVPFSRATPPTDLQRAMARHEPGDGVRLDDEPDLAG